VHKRCFGPQDSVKMAVSLVCKKCQHLEHANRDERVTPDGDDLEVVDRFLYLGDDLSSVGGVQETVTTRIRSGWKKFKEISGLLSKRGLSLKIKGTMYKKYVRSAECWAMKVEDVRRMKSTEMRMLRMICGKTVRDKVRN